MTEKPHILVVDDEPAIRLTLETGLSLTQKQLTDVKKGFKKARETAGIKNLHFHDLRHTTATRLAENGNDIVTIAEILGHKDLRMTKRYTHATSKSKRRAIDSLDNTPIDCPKFVPNKNRQVNESA